MARKQFSNELLLCAVLAASPLGATDTLPELSRRSDCGVCIQRDVYFFDAHTKLEHEQQAVAVTSKAAARQLHRFTGAVRGDGRGGLVQRLGVRKGDGRVKWQDTATLAAYNLCLIESDSDAPRSSSERKQCAMDHAIKLDLEIGDIVLAEFIEQYPDQAFVDFSVADRDSSFTGDRKEAKSATENQSNHDLRALLLVNVHVPHTVNVQTDGNVDITVTQQQHAQVFSLHMDGSKPDPDSTPKWFVISTGKNWQQLTDAYLAANDIGEDVTHPRVQALARELGLTREDEPALIKLERLREWLNTNIRHINAVGKVDFHALSSEPVATIIEQGYTDCKGFERLTRALLAISGIKSSPAHLRNKLEPIGHSAHVPGWQFNHVVSYIEGEDLYVDFSGQPKSLFSSVLNDLPMTVLRSDTGRLHALHDKELVSLKRLKADLRKLGIEPESGKK